MYKVKLRHIDKVAIYRFFVVLEDSPGLLGMPDIELLGILKIMFDVVEGQQADRKFDSQSVEPSSTLGYRANTDRESRSNNVDVINSNSNFPDYFGSNADREANKGQTS